MKLDRFHARMPCVGAVVLAASLVACGGGDGEASDAAPHGQRATAAEYEQALLGHRDSTVLLDLDELGVETAMLSAIDIVYEHGRPTEVSVYLRSRDPQAAQALADALADIGLRRAYVIA